MAEFFIRRNTSYLIFIIAVLSIVCVALIAYSASRNTTDDLPLPETLHIQETTVPVKKTESTTMKITTPKPMEPWEKNIRIPRTTIPLHYDLMLHPDLSTDWFTGTVTILINVTEPMDYLLSHAKNMTITSTKLMDSDYINVQLKDYFDYTPNEFWVVRPMSTLQPGNYSLSIEFNGNLAGHIVGFYKSEYNTISGDKRSIATSKFQPTDARRAFPCFDEPSFKSTFTTTLIRPSKDYIALSNMPVQKEMPNSPSPGLTTVVFEKSVPMVTYLACFIVCDFDYVETSTNNNQPFRVYATIDQVDRAHYARDIGVHILNYFETYFEVDYPLPKQDMIAIPDFSSGAMEHWGLITYRETNLLYDERTSSSYNKQRVAAVVSHELAHMWFGNLVTLKWWDDLWLNEGFASYIEYKGIANYERDWDMEDQFLIEDLHPVFKLDEILSSHPIVQEVNHPDEISELFDKISYSKGASVLRMLENFIGNETFRVGVRNFLRRFEFDNAVTQDLWDDLQTVAHPTLNITRIMNTWTRQMGFPVVHVNRNANSNDLELSQERFLIDPDSIAANDSPYGYKWDIPVTYHSDVVPRTQVWLHMEDRKITLPKTSNLTWLKINVEQYGYYRVNYDSHLWAQLSELLKMGHQKLSPADRSNLIDDSFALADSGHQPYETPLDLISYLDKETHYVPWATAYNRINTLSHLLGNTKAYKLFRKFILSLVSKHYDRVGWNDIGKHIERRHRVHILNLACANGHPACVAEAVDRFKKWIDNPRYSIPPNLRNIVYKYGIKGTGELEYDLLLDRFMNEINAQEKLKMMYGLASTAESWIADRMLELAKNSSIVRKQNYLTLLSYMAKNPATLHVVWKYLRENWEWMVENDGISNRYLGRVVRTIAFQFTDEIQLQEVKSFFEGYPDAGPGKRGRKQGLERIHQSLKWINSYVEEINSWLLENVT